MNKNFMTDKEKDYVSYILSKNFKNFKSTIDFSHIYNFIGQKQDYIKSSTETKTRFVFGKDLFRDNKKSRHFKSSDCFNLEMEVEQLLGKLTFSKYYYITDSCYISYEKYFKIPKFWLFLEKIKIDEDFVQSILMNFMLIENSIYFRSFIDLKYDEIKIKNKIPELFEDMFMSTDTGLILATCLLINSYNKIFYKNFIKNPNFKFKEVWNFLAVLAINSNNEEKAELIKISREFIFEIKEEERDLLRNFIKSLGLNFEDLSI